MGTIEEDSPESELRQSLEIISAVTDSPVTRFTINPKQFDGCLVSRFPFSSQIHIGEYKMNFWHILEERRIMGETLWGVEHAGYQIRNKDNKVIDRASFGSSEAYSFREIQEDKKVIDRARTNFLIHKLGGINVEHPSYMNYEDYTSESLKGDHDYFRSIYLVLMCDLKEKGVKLPPILSKDEEIRTAMFKGDVETLDQILIQRMNEIKLEYNPGMLKHVIYESDEIKKRALKQRQYYDKNIPLIEKLAYIDVKTVPGNNTQKKYNILVVEDFGEHFPDFGSEGRMGEKVAKELESLGKYGGTNIFLTVNLPECIEICGSGQIDAIVMDAGHFFAGMAMNIMKEAGGDVKMSEDDMGREIPEMDGCGEKLDWRNRIYRVLEGRGYNLPPCRIVPKNIMNMPVGLLINRMLNQ
jgi:hypothetical protein